MLVCKKCVAGQPAITGNSTGLDETDFTGSPMIKNASPDKTITEATGHIFIKICIYHSGTAVVQGS